MSIASGYGPDWTTEGGRVVELQRRVVELEQQLAVTRAEAQERSAHVTVELQRRVVELEQQLAVAQAEAREWRERAEKAERNYQWMVERAADQHLSGYRELARRAADAENVADGLRAELARVRGSRTEAALRQLKHDLETAGVSAFMSPEKLPKEEWYSSAAFCRDVVRRACYVVEDLIAALSPAPEPYPPCQGANCGATDGVSHSEECRRERGQEGR